MILALVRRTWAATAVFTVVAGFLGYFSGVVAPACVALLLTPPIWDAMVIRFERPIGGRCICAGILVGIVAQTNGWILFCMAGGASHMGLAGLAYIFILPVSWGAAIVIGGLAGGLLAPLYSKGRSGL